MDNDDEGHAANSVKNVHFKILRLPFEMQYLEDLRKLEESVWSVESLVPYVPSAEWMVQHRFVEPEAAAESSVVEVPMETSTSQSEALPSLETSREVAVVQNRSQQESLSSLDSLPPYLPSTSWLADFGNVYYYSKLPLNVQEQVTIVGAPADQLAVWKTPGKEQRGQRPTTAAAPHRRKEEKRRRCRKTEGRGDLDRDGAPAPPDEARRNCGRCLTKRNVSAGPDLTTAATVKRHRATHPSAASDPPKTLTCSACECGSVKPATRKRPVPGVPGHRVEGEEMEDEAVENRAHPTVTKQQQQGGEPGMAVDARKPASSKRHSEMCSVALCSKLREQNCSCENPQRGPAREGQRRGLLADTTKEGNEIAAPSIPAADKWKTAEQKSHQTEKLWRATVAISDRESSENGERPRNVNKPKKMSTQTQERQQFKMSNKAVTPRSQNTDFGEPIEGYYKRSNWTKGTHRRDTRY
ncbi:hypothetical protein AAFF_G00057560 [Aldrovandia affinis]|uniref:Uncharacterized protein n=1 Tax=Aldrovandia affinis TaxID=143900 RepID=A0AAD7WEC9_9TELE|nr:hypothetical protein AAFF_G00057560 [Aldrovandia affinis]